MSITILGISAYYHDSAAALLRDGVIVAAAQEERFTRRKHDPRFPRNAIAAVLDHAGIALAENGADLIEGVLRPLPQELVIPVFGGHEPPEGSQQGWLLDAGDQLDGKQIAIDVTLCLLAALLALMSWRGAFTREDAEGESAASV